jgi:hypothetical protein
MTPRRIVFLSLLVIPLSMIIISIIWSDLAQSHPELELLYLIFGVPILVLNCWEFFMPEVINHYFGKQKNNGQAMFRFRHVNPPPSFDGLLAPASGQVSPDRG